MQVSGTFKLRRYWLDYSTPQSVLDTLNWRMGTYRNPLSEYAKWGRTYYVDISYYGDSDRNLTLMEMRYAEYIYDREELVYTVDCDDGLGQEEDCNV